jgi:hypothetical protein
MDAAKVEMLCRSVGLVELPADLQRLADDDEWWERLEATPEEKLDLDQRRMVAALSARRPT